MTVPAIMTIREVAEALRCSKSHVYKMIQYGKLPGYTVAGKQVCKADDVTAYLESCLSGAVANDAGNSKLSEPSEDSASDVLLAHRTRMRLIDSSRG